MTEYLVLWPCCGRRVVLHVLVDDALGAGEADARPKREVRSMGPRILGLPSVV